MVAWRADHDPLILRRVHVKKLSLIPPTNSKSERMGKVCCPPSHSNSSRTTQVEFLKLYNTAV
jgi:hypothetical protein